VTSSASHRFLRTKSTHSTLQKSFRPDKIAELRHGNASKRERRGIVTPERRDLMRRGDHPRPMHAPQP